MRDLDFPNIPKSRAVIKTYPIISSRRNCKDHFPKSKRGTPLEHVDKNMEGPFELGTLKALLDRGAHEAMESSTLPSGTTVSHTLCIFDKLGHQEE